MAASHLVERGVAWVVHPDTPRFPPVDTGDGARLHARGIQDVDFSADEGIVGGITKRGRGLSPGGVAFVAGGAWGGGGAVSFFGGGPPSDESSDSKCHLEVFLSQILVTGGLRVGGLALGGVGGFLFHRVLTLPTLSHVPQPDPLPSPPHPPTRPRKPSPAANPSTP